MNNDEENHSDTEDKNNSKGKEAKQNCVVMMMVTFLQAIDLRLDGANLLAS
jgi:hypothetical protein